MGIKHRGQLTMVTWTRCLKRSTPRWDQRNRERSLSFQSVSKYSKKEDTSYNISRSTLVNPNGSVHTVVRFLHPGAVYTYINKTCTVRKGTEEMQKTLLGKYSQSGGLRWVNLGLLSSQALQPSIQFHLQETHGLCPEICCQQLVFQFFEYIMIFTYYYKSVSLVIKGYDYWQCVGTLCRELIRDRQMKILVIARSAGPYATG